MTRYWPKHTRQELRSGRGWFLAGIALAAMGIAAGALAAIPDGSGVIHGCYAPTKGYRLRVIDTAKTQTCPSGQVALNWNQTGPPGSSSVGGWEMVTANGGSPTGSHPGTTLDAQQTQSATAYCSSGKKVLGGGVDVSFAPGITVNASYPTNPKGATGPTAPDGAWRGTASIDPSQAGTLWNIKVFAFCANVSR
jgi:hypothetical protein